MTRTFARNVQRVKPIQKIPIGNDLSLFVADTRVARSTRKFLPDKDFEELINWIGHLSSPGVLVLSQPLISHAVGKYDAGDYVLVLGDIYNLFSDNIADHNMPYFEAQYRRLLNAIQESDHDVLVLSGDIHHGRIAQVSWRHKERLRKLVEITSSPLRVLPSSSGGWSSAVQLNELSASPKDLSQSLGVIQYLKRVPVEPGPHTSNHFMLIGFSRGSSPGAVMARVDAYSLESDSKGKPPELLWSQNVELDAPIESPQFAISRPLVILSDVAVLPRNQGMVSIQNLSSQSQNIVIKGPETEEVPLWEAQGDLKKGRGVFKASEQTLTLDSGEILRHSIEFEATDPGLVQGSLTIITEAGAERVDLYGIATTWGFRMPFFF